MDKIKLLSLISLSVFLLLSARANAFDIGINGFVQTNFSYSLSGSNPDGGDFKWAEQRGQLKLDISRADFRLFSKLDFYYDHIDRVASSSVRELYVDYVSDFFDLRAGRQIITWGLGDLIFINDVFPKDYEAYFSGRPLEYLKKGVNALKAGIYPAYFSIDLVVIPEFEPNRRPKKERFWFYNPIKAETVEHKPAKTVDNTEVAIRVYKSLSSWEMGLYFYRGFSRTPSIKPNGSRWVYFYPELSVYGVSLQGRALNGVLSLEAGYYDFREDRTGTDPFTPNSHSRFLIGYQRQLKEDFTMTIQYYGRYMHRYSKYVSTLPAGMPTQRRYRGLFSTRLTALFMHQTLRLSFFSFYSPSEGDYLLNPEVRYSYTDNIWFAVGLMAFGGGEEWSEFGQLDRNDNIYVQLRYEF